MTFKHKLSARLALMKDAVLGAVVCSALWAACSTQAGVMGPKGPDNSVTQVFVLPESLTINSGQSTQFAASGRDASGQTVPVSVRWSATGGTITSGGLFTADTVDGLFAVTATTTSGSISGNSRVKVDHHRMTSIVLTPGLVTLQIGETQQFAAYGRMNNGDSVGVTVTYTALGGTISTAGLYTAGATPGTYRVLATATTGSFADSATVVIAPPPVEAVSINPASVSLTVGGSRQLIAITTDAAGDTVTGRAVQWATSNAGVVTISPSGAATAMAPGAATITATSEGQSGTASVTTVNAPVASVSVTPAAATLLVGQNVPFVATPKDASGNALAGRVITWSTSDASLATVSASGVVTAQAAGSVTITATSEGQSGSSSITVSNVPIATVAVSPSSATLYVGATRQLIATTNDSAGNPLTGRPVAWTTSNASIASISVSGVVTAVAPGSAVITATSEGKTGSATITVALVPVASVSVTPTTASLFVGQAVQLSAATRDSAGNVLNGRAIAWTTSDSTVASVSSSGLVLAKGPGAATITASSEGKSGSASITGVKVPVASVSVTPSAAALNQGQTVQLSATPKDSAGNALAGRTIAWTSSDANVATVSAAGLVTARAAGSATITATSEGKSGAATMTVLQVPVATVTVTPASASVTTGSTIQLSATTRDSAGNTLTGRSVTWTTGNPALATVSATGLVTGLAPGAATITATSEGRTGTAGITVTTSTVTHQGWFVTANGSSSNSGTNASPWSLSYALGGAGGKIQPGDTVWVRGGTYYAPFRSTLTGTATARIVVRAYPGERAIIDGVNTTSDNFVVAGSYSIIWGLEFTNTNPSRYTSDATSHSYRADDIINSGPHNKYVNLIVHDGGVAFYTYSAYPDLEIYGGIFYNNGWESTDRGHGHALYLKNDVGPVVAKDNVIFNQYGYGIHVYTNTGDGLLNNIWLEGNVSFDNGSLSSLGTSANLGNLGQPLANSLGVVNNMTYFAPSLSGTNLELGSGAGLTATGNYVVGGSGITQGTWTGASIAGNTVLASGSASRPASVFVRPNPYEVGRANIIVYNPSGQSAVLLDLTAVLPVGAKYQIVNVQDLFGAPVVTGTYGGGTVTLPLIGVQPPVPVGLSSSPAPATGNAFNVYIVTVTP